MSCISCPYNTSPAYLIHILYILLKCNSFVCTFWMRRSIFGGFSCVSVLQCRMNINFWYLVMKRRYARSGRFTITWNSNKSMYELVAEHTANPVYSKAVGNSFRMFCLCTLRHVLLFRLYDLICWLIHNPFEFIAFVLQRFTLSIRFDSLMVFHKLHEF